LKTNNWA